MSSPPPFSRWVLDSQNGIESLRWEQNVVAKELGDQEVLIELHAASLNYRDLVIAKGIPGLPITPGLIPCSDGAGTIHSTGAAVPAALQPGDRVCTHMVPHIPPLQWPSFAHIAAGLGQQLDGTLAQFAVLHHSCVVRVPAGLGFAQAATLTCSALTAWNALFGLRAVGTGDWVLVQGTGGVAIAALQFALAAGATVVATTSSDAKAQRLRELGAAHVVNYRADARWGETARALTPDGQGFDHVVDIGGNATLEQSVRAVRIGGIVTAAGLVGGDVDGQKPALLLDALWNICTVRGVLLGTRQQFDDMNRFIERHSIKPVVDDEVFELVDAKEAYRKLEAQKHFSKIIIKIR